jgi:hypothetical protein
VEFLTFSPIFNPIVSHYSKPILGEFLKKREYLGKPTKAIFKGEFWTNRQKGRKLRISFLNQFSEIHFNFITGIGGLTKKRKNR